MGRKRREWYPGAIYHVMARGNYRQNIVQDEEDYKVFCVILQDTKKRYAFNIHAYCLMTNHYHILIETKDTELWKIMKRVNQLYATYYKY